MSLMATEAAETPQAASRQIEQHQRDFASLGRRLREKPPRFVMTAARGSSDHAAAYGKYLIETHLGLPVATAGMSVASLYETPMRMQDGLFIAISRSGQGDDLLRVTASARAGGAVVVAMVGDESSPLAREADIVLPLCTHPEQGITATKSYIASLLAFLQLVAHWQDNTGLLRQVARVPSVLAKAAALDWRPSLSKLVRSHGLYVIGRGLGASAAREMAHKCQEICRLHANAYSAADLLHGPLAVVGPGFPILALTQDDPTLEITRETIRSMVRLGAEVITTDPAQAGTLTLPVVPKLAAEITPLALAQSFYMAVPEIAADRGLNPDTPLHLTHVSRTV